VQWAFQKYVFLLQNTKTTFLHWIYKYVNINLEKTFLSLRLIAIAIKHYPISKDAHVNKILLNAISNLMKIKNAVFSFTIDVEIADAARPSN